MLHIYKVIIYITTIYYDKTNIFVKGTLIDKKIFLEDKFLDIIGNLNENEDFLNNTNLNLSKKYAHNMFKYAKSCTHLRFMTFSNKILETVPCKLEKYTSIDLSKNFIFEIEKEICEFTNLEILDLSSNNIIIIPKYFIFLKNLKSLNISKNPIEIISNIPLSLETLILKSTKLKILPMDVINLKNLKNLVLEDNLLFNLPESFNKMQSLEKLNLNSNLFEKIPDQIFNLKNLRCLRLNNLNIKIVNPSIENLKNLIYLDLSSCKLSFLAKEIFELKFLKYININSNKIQELPELVKNLQKIEFLFCEDNYIQEINLEILTLSTLRILNFTNNKINILPSSINKLANLEFLHLSNNKLKDFPNDCENLLKLDFLDLSKNEIKDFSTISKIKNLKKLILCSNKITEIPNNISNLQNLQELYLSNNQIFNLPKELLKCTKIEKLILNNNKIEKIPVEFLNFFGNLKILDLKENPINLFGNFKELGFYELKKKLGVKFLSDNFDVSKIYNYFKTETCYFNIENLKNCKITFLPIKFNSEQELLAKINEWSTLNTEFMNNIFEQRNEHYYSNKTIIHSMLNKEDISFLISYIKILYGFNSRITLSKSNNKDFTNKKRIISAVINKLFSANSGKYIKNHLNRFVKNKNQNFSIQSAELVYLYDNLMFEEKIDLFYLIKKDLTLKTEHNDFNLEFFVENTIIKFIGLEKIRMVKKLFADPFQSEIGILYNNCKINIAKHVGIDVYEELFFYPQNDSLHNCFELELIDFFKEFTPELIIKRLKNAINKDARFKNKIVEYIKYMNFDKKIEFIERNKNDMSIFSIKIEFCEYILKKMKIIIFNK